MKTHLKAATKFTPKSPQTRITTTLQRHSIGQSLNQRIANKISSLTITENKNSYCNLKKTSLFSSDLCSSTNNKQQHINSYSEKSNHYSIKKSINTSKNLIIQTQSRSRIPIARPRPNRQNFLRIRRNYIRDSNDINFRRLYSFQRNHPHLVRNIARIRRRLVRDVAAIYSDRINLNGASISYDHARRISLPRRRGHGRRGVPTNAIARPDTNEIRVYSDSMNQQFNSFLRIIRNQSLRLARLSGRNNREIEIPNRLNSLRQFREYNANPTPNNFRHLYNFQKEHPNIINIVPIRKILVRDVATIYSDRIDLKDASISYDHSRRISLPRRRGHRRGGRPSNAIARPDTNEIIVYSDGMNQECNSFLNTIRHEGFHIAQFKARQPRRRGQTRRRGQIPNLGNTRNNRALLEFLSEYREIVGGFEENLKPFSSDVGRFVDNYYKITPDLFNRRWRERIILNKGVQAAETLTENELRRRIVRQAARQNKTVNTLRFEERDTLSVLRRCRTRIITRNQLFRNF